MELFTWTTLLTLAGATAAVLLILQFTKPLLPPKFPTRLAAVLLAFVILEVATAVSGGTLEQYGIAVFNAFLVATGAMGAYEVTFKAGDDAKKSDGGGIAGP
jgi:hypothetical protein